MNWIDKYISKLKCLLQQTTINFIAWFVDARLRLTQKCILSFLLNHFIHIPIRPEEIPRKKKDRRRENVPIQFHRPLYIRLEYRCLESCCDSSSFEFCHLRFASCCLRHKPTESYCFYSIWFSCSLSVNCQQLIRCKEIDESTYITILFHLPLSCSVRVSCSILSFCITITTNMAGWLASLNNRIDGNTTGRQHKRQWMRWMTKQSNDSHTHYEHPSNTIE